MNCESCTAAHGRERGRERDDEGAVHVVANDGEWQANEKDDDEAEESADEDDESPCLLLGQLVLWYCVESVRPGPPPPSMPDH
jgi:hypothetical protein